jgi:hypothetical protein
MIALNVAVGVEWALDADVISRCHYLRTFPDPRCMPLVYSVRLDGEWIGTLVFGRPESNRCYQGELTYGSIADRGAGRARFDRWEVLNLARVWLTPEVQRGGRLCVPGIVPGFTDRCGVFRSTLASEVVQLAIRSIRLDYLLMYPPCFLAEPYQLRVILSYCDRRIHRGTLYSASGFALARTNRDHVETWYYDRLAPLDPEHDAQVRHASKYTDRSIRKRHARVRSNFQRIFWEVS